MTRIKVRCPNSACGQVYLVDGSYVGKSGRCKKCDTVFRMAAETKAAAAPPPAKGKGVDELVFELTRYDSIADPRPIWKQLCDQPAAAGPVATDALVKFLRGSHPNVRKRNGEFNYAGLSTLVSLLAELGHEPAVEPLGAVVETYSGSNVWEAVQIAGAAEKAIATIQRGPAPAAEDEATLEVDRNRPWDQIAEISSLLRDMFHDEEQCKAVERWYHEFKKALPDLSISDVNKSNCWRELGSIISRLETGSSDAFLSESAEAGCCLEQAIKLQPDRERQRHLEDMYRKVTGRRYKG